MTALDHAPLEQNTAGVSTPLLAVTGGLALGGSTTFLLNLGQAFRDRSISLPVLCLSEQHEMAPDFTAAGVPVQVIGRRQLIYEDRTGQGYLYAAAQRPTAVLACLGSDSFEMLRVVPRHVVRLGIIQSDDPGPYAMAREYAPWLDAMVGVSETICRRLREDAVYGNIRIECIPYGIHFPLRDARAARDPAAPLRIIYLGRMAELQKRISRLLELARLLSSRGERFEFTFGGAGPELNSAKESLRNLPSVRFLGDVPNREVNGLLRSQDVFVLLSDFEGLPLSLLEAMGEGVVPVVSDLESGIREVVTAETGFRVPVGDVAAAADAIGRLAHDPAQYARMSAAARRLVRDNYSSARMAERYLRLIAELARGQAVWPAEVSVPVPRLVRHPWLHRGLARRLRRILKRVSGR